MPDDLETELRKVKSALAKARALRTIIKEAPEQLRRDAAIITYTRIIDDLIQRLHRLDEAGVFDRMLAQAILDDLNA
ncbi:hypothetical protein G5B38_10330 [Pseudohalocynthiibacter aestuariivivens]|nr:hypothetical protein [Pseudohalocynthiibacter aestuariivivens]QIE45892.1 hypothetical protein G5B38_10330 [Pseudohalocynthiibacter aestuariivivens]